MSSRKGIPNRAGLLADWSQEDVDDFTVRWKRGDPIARIAEWFGVTYAQVRHTKSVLGLETRKRCDVRIKRLNLELRPEVYDRFKAMAASRCVPMTRMLEQLMDHHDTGLGLTELGKDKT